MSPRLKQVLLLAAALVMAILCTFIVNRIVCGSEGYTETETEESPVFTDENDAFGISGCEIKDNKVLITGADPQFVVKANEEEISLVHIVFSEPVTNNTPLQLFYSHPGEGFSEANSVHRIILSGADEERIVLPKAVYSNFRFDFDRNVSLKEITGGEEIQVEYAYGPNALRLIFIAVLLFGTFSIPVLLLTRKKEDKSLKNGRPWFAVALSNLLLSLTVVFFQPMEHLLVNHTSFLFSFSQVWWIQIIWAFGITAVLSLLMLILPPKAGRIAASVPLGIGLAFLVQALLLDGGRPIEMNTTWPMEVLNIFVWFGIIAMTVSMVVYFIKEQEKRTDTVTSIIAWILIVLQAMNIMILTGTAQVSADGEKIRPVIQEKKTDNELELMNLEGNLIKISMCRGMPFHMKLFFTYDAETVNRTSFKQKEQVSDEIDGEELADDSWELTQYPDQSGNVGLFYSLYHPSDGFLILIDSGNPANAEQVRQVIDGHGGHVNAWFLTHYHGDHIGAFNTLWKEYKDKIDVIYVNPLDWDTFAPIYHDWDTPEAFSGFLEETKDAINVVTLYSGDELEIDGLKVKVFSSFDEHVKELSTDWPNDSSIVFKVSATEESVLFMGDLSRAAVPLGQYIIDTYGAEEVRADYIQAGHHGNWGQPVSFYEQLMPKVIFQDGPEWLITGEQYDAKDLAAWCAENGIITYDYRQAPITVQLR